MKQTLKFKTRDMHRKCSEGSVSSKMGTTKEFESFRCTMTIITPTIYQSGNVKNSGKKDNEIIHSNPDSFRYHPISIN